MAKRRLEAFSDGVLAISTMALEAKLPQGEGVDPLQPLLPLFLSYAPSFVEVGIQ
ncbi:MAG TPA: TMEM175 family protein [Rhodanobacteraceae bacterium]|nr:TMEM175 family protein [Rhodanobacteraceae bacterium]